MGEGQLCCGTANRGAIFAWDQGHFSTSNCRKPPLARVWGRCVALPTNISILNCSYNMAFAAPPSTFRTFLPTVQRNSFTRAPCHHPLLRRPYRQPALRTHFCSASQPPSTPTSNSIAMTPSIVSTDASTRLSLLRAELRTRGLDAFIVPSTDPHNSEYTASCFERRAFISQFTGSAGTAVITADAAYLWTDGRYFLQAETQLDTNSGWELMRAGLPETPTISVFLAEHLPPGSKIGIDPTLHSVDAADSIRAALEPVGSTLQLEPTPNPVDVVWAEARPAYPQGAVRIHESEYAGMDTPEKLNNLRSQMKTRAAHALILSMLDEVAWLFNIRGDDVPHCPVVIAYAMVTQDQATLYLDLSKVSSDVADRLAHDGVTISPYEAVVDDAQAIAKTGTIWFDPSSTSAALAAAVMNAQNYISMNGSEGKPASVIREPTPVVLAKAIKNEAELNGMLNAHIHDGVGLCSFLCWLENLVRSGDSISEVDAAKKLESFRAARPGFIMNSFDTIAGVGPNGAIIHYRAEEESCSIITGDEVFLLDSGGQYVDGTTDVTRTMHLKGAASEFEKQCFTRVLQGHIALDSTVFPRGTTGLMIDSFARRRLWAAGLDYRHGTGHGVGACLNVHEGPQSISGRPNSNKTALQQGMIVSNEPGYYEDGKFGIRLENLMYIVKKNTEHQFGGTDFLGFEPLTHVPIDKGMIITKMMDAAEIAWLDEYHEQVWQKLSVLMSDDDPARHWLWEKTRPLGQ